MDSMTTAVTANRSNKRSAPSVATSIEANEDATPPATTAKASSPTGSSSSNANVATAATTTTSNRPWKVVRLAAKDHRRRQKEGGDFKSHQKKIECDRLQIEWDGVKGIRKGWFLNETIEDYNNYRTQGHTGRFTAKTRDRSVSIATVAGYNTLRKAFVASDDATANSSNNSEEPSATIVMDGDLGDNILIDGPLAVADPSGKHGDGDGLYVGAQLRLGTAMVELTEANNPCYRFNTQPWAKRAKGIWGKTAPEQTPAKWFKSPQCPLNNMVYPGIRGWLAKVIKEGTVEKNDTVELVSQSPKTSCCKGETAGNVEEQGGEIINDKKNKNTDSLMMPKNKKLKTTPTPA